VTRAAAWRSIPLGAWLLVALVAAACTDGDDAGPSPTTQATATTSTVDLSGVALPGVGGETTTTIDEVGTARLVGSVRGPDGPVPGAAVQIDRLVAGRQVRHDLRTGPDGRWELPNVPGGRYRVRAYLAPSLAQTTADVRFLNDGEEHTFDLVVEDQRGVVVRADVAPDQPTLGNAVNLVVLVARRVVSEDGVVRSTPVSGAFVELQGLGRWELRDDDAGGGDGGVDGGLGTTSTTFDTGPSRSALLSSGGQARFELRCVTTGAPGLSLRVPGVVDATTATSVGTPADEIVLLELPACIDPTATTTTTSPGGRSSTTSSTVP
jgi:hypothetical protein